MKCAQADKMDAGNSPAKVCSHRLMAKVAAGQIGSPASCCTGDMNSLRVSASLFTVLKDQCG